MNRKKKKRTGIIYSTKNDFEYNDEYDKIETLQASDQNLEIHIDKHRAGKTAVIIKNFIGSKEDLNLLSKTLKNRCGVGGTAKNNQIIIQGDLRNKVIEILEEKGYNYKKVGG